MAFPNNIIQVLDLWFKDQVDDDPDPKTKVKVFKRQLRPTDPNQCIGLVPRMWTPDQNSFEMGGPFYGATLQTYTVTVMCFVKDMDEVRGLNAHAKLSTIVRRILGYDQDLRLALGQLGITIGGITERLQRWGVTGATYLNNEIDGQFNYLCNIETYFETETG